MLAQDVGGIAVRVDEGVPFRIREQVDLTVGLLEWLANFMLHQPLPPLHDNL